MELIDKFLDQLKNRGIAKTLVKSIFYPVSRVRRRRFLVQIANQGVSEVFAGIYSDKYWGRGESVSGVGSSLVQTENLRSHLPVIFKKFDVVAVLDAPCGDMNWMIAVPKEKGMTYIGGDIVDKLIERNRNMYTDKIHKFVKLDIINDPLPEVDLMICRDCLFHFSYEDTLSFLENFSKSDIPLLMTTTYKNNASFNNSDILTGDYRRIDLFQRPYSLSEEVLYRLDDYLAPEAEREMCIWTKEQIMEACEFMSRTLSGEKVGITA